MFCWGLVFHSFCFHYRADVLLGFSDPLHLREVRYGRGSAHRVLVLYLPGAEFGRREVKRANQ